MGKIALVGSAVLSVVLADAAQAATLTSYDFQDVGMFGTSTSLASSASGISGTDLTMEGLGSATLFEAAILSSDYVDPLDPGVYFEWALNPLPGYKMSLSAVNFTFYTEEGGAERFKLTANGADVTTQANVFAPTEYTVFLGGSYSNLQSPVTFRLYPYRSLNGRYGLANTASVEGLVASIPEPALLGLGALLLPLMSRRRPARS